MKRLSLVLYLSLVFLSGVLVGGLGQRFWAVKAKTEHPADPRQQYLEEMQTRLRLRPDQVERLNNILGATHDRFREIRKKWAPEVRAIQETQTTQIREMLDESQRAEYEKMRQERDKRRRDGR